MITNNLAILALALMFVIFALLLIMVHVRSYLQHRKLLRWLRNITAQSIDERFENLMYQQEQEALMDAYQDKLTAANEAARKELWAAQDQATDNQRRINP